MKDISETDPEIMDRMDVRLKTGACWGKECA